MFEAAAVLDNHFETFPDILEDVGGHDVQEGVLEELHEDEEAEAVNQDTSQPETVAAQGETGVVKEPREVGFSYSHLDSASTSCTHITISNRGGVFDMSVYFEMKYSKQYAEWAL